ncbi:disease resistance-like protein DSC1 [Argentina anserina]|uniref:disease resistance-like protein DSC1 n=1 Tax=Argentina anserina TaxID=57926 RepID=UPI0021764DAC|nr:disease resistance-like protein DSC1 [Potentilla anserina]
MASSSVDALKYDVFLSFRGEDTRSTFTSHLHAALKQKQIKTYIDYELVRGEEIAPALIKAIKGSELSVVILSQDYASSKWCLDELVHILECKESHGQIVIPIFYGVDSSDVRHQRESYAAAFLHHEERFQDTPNRVLKWREVLTKASNLAGFDSRNFGRESELIEEVIRDILMKLSEECSSDLEGLVGMESRIQKLESLLCIVPEDVRVRTVGIWGMGGVGKTTLAGLVFNQLKSQFEASHFLADVREESGKHGIKALRNELIRNLLKDESLTIATPSIGTTLIKKRLSQAKFLVVLDDVDNVSQLEILVGIQVQFGPGSRIIITTRDKHQLREMQRLQKGADRDVIMYKAKELDHKEALQLFQSNFFEDISGRSDYSEIIHSAAGIPLALKIWGSVFRRRKTTQERESLLEKLKKSSGTDLQKVYRISYDALGEHEREIFLYIACFYKGEEVRRAKEQLNACGLDADNGIDVLIDMSLVSIRYDKLWMHDVIQEMGRAIECEQHPAKPGKRKHLFTPEDVCHVLKKNKGTKNVQSISLDLSTITQLQLTPQAFKKMRNLKFLKLDGGDWTGNVHFNLQDLKYLPDSLIYINWPTYSLKYLPATFSAENLTELCMPGSRLKRLWNEGQKPRNLKRIDLSRSRELVEVPDLSLCVNIERIDLERCERLVEVPSYFQNLHKLTRLNVDRCRNLRVLSDMPSNMVDLKLGRTTIEELPSSIWCLEKLDELRPCWCEGIKTLPNSIWKLYSVRDLTLTGTSIQELPSSIECLCNLKTLSLSDCKRFVSLPTSICKLKSLLELSLRGCSSFEKFPEILEPMELLRIVKLGGTKLKELPCLIENAVGRKESELPGCTCFESVPNSTLPPYSSVILWPSMNWLILSGCRMLEEIPDCIFSLNWLFTLDLGGSMIRRIPSTINQASRLEELILRNCELLESLPELPYDLEYIDASGCKRLKTFSGFTTALTEDSKPVNCNRIFRNFSDCGSLDENARRHIMDDAHLLSTFYLVLCKRDYEVRCSGSEIPKWVRNQMEGSRIDITLPPHWIKDANFLGFALSVVIDFRKASHAEICTGEYIFKSEDGESYTWGTGTFDDKWCRGKSENMVVVWFEALQRMWLAPCTNATRASFHFKLTGYDQEEYEVERCGVGFVYAQGLDENAVDWQIMDEQHGEATASENSD